MDDTEDNGCVCGGCGCGDEGEQGEAPRADGAPDGDATREAFADLVQLTAATWACPACGAKGIVIAQAVIEQIAKDGITDKCGKCGVGIRVRPRMISCGSPLGANRHTRRAAAASANTPHKRLVLASK